MRRRLHRDLKPAIVPIALVLLSAAPSVGNLGSCGQQAELLDAEKFFRAKAAVDCNRCSECGFATSACRDACEQRLDADVFPEGCYPLVHDGEVCLDALDASACGTFEAFVAEEGATFPTECNFCPIDDQGQPDTEEELP
jgi:hypothetical protein